MTRFALALALVVFARPALAETIERPAADLMAQTLTIRIYTVRAPEEPAPSARVLASSLLREAGIGSRWMSCGATHADASCARPLTSSELAMRLVPHAPSATGVSAVPMGTSLVDTSRRTGVLATLYLDRIDSLARATGTGADVILARAIAHEAAHLVLGTTEHGLTGLMRALWSRDMLRDEPASDWVFTSDEGRRMREALAERK